MNPFQPEKEDIAICIVFFAFIFVGIFVGVQELAKDHLSFLLLMFSSFVFLGVGTFLLFLAMTVKGHWALSIIAIIFIVATLFVGNSIATVPRGGLRHSFDISPDNVEGILRDKQADPNVGKYLFDEVTESGAPGITYQIVHRVWYSVAYAKASYRLGKVYVHTQENVSLSGRLIIRLILQNHRSSDRYINIYFNHTGYTSSVEPSISDLWVSWGRWDNQYHAFPYDDNGYKLYLYVSVSFNGTDYGPELNAQIDIPKDPGISITDVQAASRFENGLALVLCGVFIGVLCYIPGISLKRKLFSTKLG